MWIVAGLSTLILAGILTGLAYLPGRSGRAHPGRKASLLGIAAAVGFGFVAAVIKELSAHLSQGPAGVFSNWSPYVLLLAGAASMFLASNAFQAGSLAASQPGLTVVDPLVASVLGVVLFGERLTLDPAALAGEVLALSLLVSSVVMLSRSPLVHDEPDRASPSPSPMPVPTPLLRVDRPQLPVPTPARVPVAAAVPVSLSARSPRRGREAAAGPRSSVA